MCLVALAFAVFPNPAATQQTSPTPARSRSVLLQDLPTCYALYHFTGQPASESLYWAPTATRVRADGVLERLDHKERHQRGQSQWMRDSLSDSVRLSFSSGFGGTIFTLGAGQDVWMLRGRAAQFRDFGPDAGTVGSPAFAVRIDCPGDDVDIADAPSDSFLFQGTRRWGRTSSLGDLQERAFAPEDIEVRAWGGYGIGGTSAIVARREAGNWRAWSAEFVGCNISVATSIADTASAETRKGFIAAARKNCYSSIGDTRRGAVMYLSDSVEVTPLPASSAAIDSAWNDAVNAGLLALPASVPRTWTMLDGVTYLLEVRRGREYRASMIESLDTPEVEADRQVKVVFAALSRLRKPQ